MSHNKLVVATCIGVSVGAISGITWNLLTELPKKNKPTEDTELSVVNRPPCKCPMANFVGVAITGGVLSGALAWFYYPR